MVHFSIGSHRTVRCVVSALLFTIGWLPVAPLMPSVIAQVAGEPFTTIWSSAEHDSTNSVAWGDVDGDGDLDLATSNGYGPIRLYRNESGVLTQNAIWSLTKNDSTQSLAWGDVDNDGDLDLAVGNFFKSAQLYRNEGGVLMSSAVWSSSESDNTTSLAWGDVDNDGDLDLATGAFVGSIRGRNRLYRNEGGVLTQSAIWSSNESDDTTSITWGDVDGDGYLDLATGNFGGPNRLYRNAGGVLTQSAIWSSNESDNTTSIAWGDADGDGKLDLAAGNDGQPNRLYHNEGGVLTQSAIWSSIESDNTASIAWGDLDGDGYLDLAAGNDGQPNRLYRNVQGVLAQSAVWSSTASDNTRDVAWGDVDGDSDLDLAVGNRTGSNRLYRNETTLLTQSAVWASTESDGTAGVAWGDVDRDGDLDLAAGNYGQPNHLYRNEGGVLSQGAIWTSVETTTLSMAWGDVDGDGYLDLAICTFAGPIRLYRNEGGVLTQSTVWSSAETAASSIAWGDVDGDGDLDLAAGNDGQPTRLYRNVQGVLMPSAVWASTESDNTSSVAWGDVDGDSDLDLATSNRTGPNRLYRNENGVLTRSAIWSSAEIYYTLAMAWGDIDGDDDLDLAIGTYDGNRLYHNEGGVLTQNPVWFSTENDHTSSLAWGDVDGDGDLDLATGNWYTPIRLYRNEGGVLTQSAVWSSTESGNFIRVAWGDLDGDGDLDLAAGGSQKRLYRNLSSTATRRPFDSPATVTVTGPEASRGAAFYATARLLSDPIIPIHYTLTDAENDTVRVQAEYSLNGGGLWRPAVPSSDTITTNLAAAPAGTSHIFGWDTLASGMFGQSDNVLFRIRALSNLRPRPNSIPGPYQRPSTVSSTFPFRVRGTQPRVLRDGQPLAGAQVYRLPAGATTGATLVAEPSGRTFRTNHLGYLEGRGAVALGDRLVALQEVGRTEQYSLYYTSAAPTASGLDALTVTQPGVQTLTVSSANPLMLLHLSVSLEWDARSDVDFMRRLRDDLQRVSSTLYDWSDGQIALGTITIYQNKERWYDTLDAQGNLVQKGADIRVRASNRVRPNASQGGITSQELTETIPRTDGTTSTIIYEPGSVRLGAVWNRDGSPDLREQSSDWARALAHELGHYALYLDDNYLGLNAAKQLVAVHSCPGAMSDPYASGGIDLRPDADWLPACQDTLSNRTSGRSDWATIKRFYDGAAAGFQFNQPTSYHAKPGPSTLPLAVTQFVEPAPPTAGGATTRSVPLTAGGAYAASGAARAVAFSADGKELRDLGQPTTDGRIIARGVQPGDELCVYDLPAARLGCGPASTSALALGSRSDWQPDVLLTPVTSRTLQIAVPAEGVGAPAPSTLKARLFPADTGQASVDTDLALNNGRYVGTFSPAAPVLEGVVRVWVAGDSAPRREVVTDFALGGNPAPPRRPPKRSRRKAPVISSDGQVILFTDGLDFKNGEFFSLQTVTRLPASPPTAVPIGPGYRLITSNPAPSLAGVGINMAFAADELPVGVSSDWVALYYYPADGSGWRRLSTLPGTAGSSEVNAQVAGSGIYALMASLPLTIGERGWNQIAYPGTTALLPGALEPVVGSYRLIYGYDTATDDPLQAWQVYAPDVPPWVNDLQRLNEGDPYWIYVTEPLTAPVKPPAATLQATRPQAGSPLSFPPALFYGTFEPTEGFTPAPGMAVEAHINGVLCGAATTRLEGGKVVVAIDVLAAGSGATARCGADGLPITFTIGDYVWPVTPAWDNTRLNELKLYRLLLPIAFSTPTPEPPPDDEPSGEEAGGE